MMKMDFTGRVAIITGAASGIGEATALAFAKTGAALVLVDIDQDKLNKVKEEVEKSAKEVITFVTDVSKWDQVKDMADSVAEKYGRIDILVNNAGFEFIDKMFQEGKKFSNLDMTDEDYDRVVNVNMKGQFNCAKAVLPYMVKQNYGRIINIGSSTAIGGHFSTAPYIATKGGIHSQTKALAREFGQYNICINCVAPGLVITPLHDGTPKKVLDMAASKVALGRPAYPADIAHAILFFASDELFITGQTLVVDGGSTMH